MFAVGMLVGVVVALPLGALIGVLVLASPGFRAYDALDPTP